MIPCACNCGELIPEINKKGKPARYKHGHNGKGENNPRWLGGEIKHGKYWYIKNIGHRLADSQGYVKKHRLVYEEYYKCCLLDHTEIHHIDHNRDNNDVSNLMPLTKAQHTSLEMQGNTYASAGKGKPKSLEHRMKIAASHNPKSDLNLFYNLIRQKA